MPMRAALFQGRPRRLQAVREPAAVDTVSSVKDMAEMGAQQLAGDVLAAISALRRVARRAARSAWSAQPLPSAQSELLRLAASRPGISVTEAAADLRLAPNTVSTL